jgi:SAM-dependent methyltransferase
LSEVIKAFDEASDTYEDWYRRPKGFQVLLSELRGLEALLPPSGLGAEVGAGTGIFAGRLTSEERRVVCIDPSPGMLKHTVGRGLPAILSTGEECPFKRGSLAFAYMVTALEFMPDPVGALRSVGSALKEEAPLVTLTINRVSPWGELYAEMAEKGDPIFSHARLFSFEEVHDLLMIAGFEPREAVGTLTAAPDETEEENRLVPVGPGVGVILIKARRRTHPPTEYPDHSTCLQRPRR